MSNKSNLKLLLVTLILVPLFLIGCKKKTEEEKLVITVKGSDTMVNLSQKWAEEYMKKYPNVSIQVTGGGSGTGIAALLNGTTDLANASREMEQKELELAAEQEIKPIQYDVALDGIAIIIHPSNNIDNLTIAQLGDIFTGKITNWKQIGGNNMRSEER